MRSYRMLMLVTLIAVSTVSAGAVTNLGFNSIGLRLGYVKPEDPIGGTIGFGAQADFGTITPDLHLDGLLEFWSKSREVGYGYSDSYSDLGIGAMLKYYFEINSELKPYAAAGLAFQLEHFKTELPPPFGNASDNKTEIGLHLIGGAELPINNQIDGLAELKYVISDINYFGIFLGANYKIGK